MLHIVQGDPEEFGHPHDTVAEAKQCEHDSLLARDEVRAENAWLVTRHEQAYRGHTPRQVAEEAFRLADGCVMSAKKDGIVHIGGFIGLNDPELAEKCERLLIATEGFATYGGLAGRDLDMMATGLLEVTEPAYLAERADVASHLADRVRMIVGEDPRIAEKYMFGGLTFLLNGHILVGCKKDGSILISVGKDNHEAAAARPGTTAMVHNGRVMSGFFWVDGDAIEDDDALLDWIRFAEQAVGQRPVKPDKPKKPRAKEARA